MGLFNRLFSRSGPAAAPQSAAQITKAKPKSLAEIERELERELERERQQPIQLRPVNSPRSRQGGGGFLGKLLGLSLLVGIPVGILWAINLPYAPIRRPIAETAPVLLLPSYISLDNNYKAAIALTQQAKQLIDSPTSAADIDAGQRKAIAAQKRLDELPVWLRDYWYDGWSGLHNWRFSTTGFNNARTEVARLQAKAAQEQNAQTTLVTAEQAIAQAKQTYQQAVNPADQAGAIAAWRVALQDLELIPSQTLAGRTARARHAAAEAEFRTTVGLAAESAKVNAQIENARQFAWQAAKAAENPPHTVAEWERVMELWREAIARLERVPSEDLQGKAAAETLLATYQANLGQIRVRRDAEDSAVRRMEQINRDIQQFQQLAGRTDANTQISQLNRILADLKQIPNGTTVYKDAELLTLQAQNALDKLVGR
ncbi:MAG: hypothetical protein D6742_09150 [Cyanobacteria bacterium J069]|nr:MAG: hypothetical protein D6742_09150 [Cyanobacteria bacterium J069]